MFENPLGEVFRKRRVVADEGWATARSARDAPTLRQHVTRVDEGGTPIHVFRQNVQRASNRRLIKGRREGQQKPVSARSAGYDKVAAEAGPRADRRANKDKGPPKGGPSKGPVTRPGAKVYRQAWIRARPHRAAPRLRRNAHEMRRTREHGMSWGGTRHSLVSSQADPPAQCRSRARRRPRRERCAGSSAPATLTRRLRRLRALLVLCAPSSVAPLGHDGRRGPPCPWRRFGAAAFHLPRGHRPPKLLGVLSAGTPGTRTTSGSASAGFMRLGQSQRTQTGSVAKTHRMWEPQRGQRSSPSKDSWVIRLPFLGAARTGANEVGRRQQGPGHARTNCTTRLRRPRDGVRARRRRLGSTGGILRGVVW